MIFILTDVSSYSAYGIFCGSEEGKAHRNTSIYYLQIHHNFDKLPVTHLNPYPSVCED